MSGSKFGWGGELNSARLRYERLTTDDLDDYASWYSDPAVMKYITGYPLDPSQIEARFASALDTNAEQAVMGWFLAYLKDGGSFVGIAKLTPWESEDVRATEIGYGLLPAYWGAGYATEMLDTMIKLARQLDLNKLVGIVSAENDASIRVLEKFDFLKGGGDSGDGVRYFFEF